MYTCRVIVMSFTGFGEEPLLTRECQVGFLPVPTVVCFRNGTQIIILTVKSGLSFCFRPIADPLRPGLIYKGKLDMVQPLRYTHLPEICSTILSWQYVMFVILCDVP